MSKVIGIISYFPDKQPDRDLRIGRFNALLKTLDKLFTGIPVMVVAQNWKDYEPKGNYLDIHKYDKLGILGARKTLRGLFLNSGYGNMITMDDDVIIKGESGKEFLKQIDDNPNGMGVFCWEHSQLNLLYISKSIYSQVDIPNINPENDEGFEDVVFTSTCRAMFPDKVFTFKDTGLTESSFRYTGNDKVPSTWAGGIHDWKKLRENTKKIRENIEKGLPFNVAVSQEHVKVNRDGIDLVVTYVDSSDPQWQRLYKKHAPEEVREDSNGKQRFRDNPNFRHFFRGIELYTPWINNVFLVVQSLSQVPSWLDVTKVRIVLHEDFIPKEFLPVFSSQAIEMFLHLIPGLNEKFLYANDDVYFIGPLRPENFFLNDKVKTSFKVTTLSNIEPLPLWQQSIINSGMLVNKKETEKIKKQGQYMTPMHSTRPYLKSKMEEAFNKHKEIILSSITKFREGNNFTIYLYDFYLKTLGLVMERDYMFYHYGSKTPLAFIGNCLVNPQTNKVMCLNDSSEELNPEREQYIKDKFNHKFPNKSKYER